MKAVVLVCASVITLLITTPAHAAIWDLSWLAEGFFNRLPDAPPVNRSQSGTSTATIAPQPSGGIVIGFDTPFGASSVNVPPDGPAIGNVPVFQDRNAPPVVFKGDVIGTYSFSGGTFSNPDTFNLDLRHNGSGPDPLTLFTATGVRHTAEAAEPEVALLLLGSLTVVAWLRRQRR